MLAASRWQRRARSRAVNDATDVLVREELDRGHDTCVELYESVYRVLIATHRAEQVASSGGGGSRVASWQVNSYIGSACPSRADWKSSIAASNVRTPDRESFRAAAQSSASRKAS